MTDKAHRTGRPGIPPRDHYAEVTNQVIAALEAGTAPWRRPWDSGKATGPSMPCNATTGIRYRGINVVVLGMSPLAFHSGDPRWATYRQAAERGWQVCRGARGTTAYFFKRVEVRDHDETAGDAEVTKRIPLLRTFTLFHASQIDGIPGYVPPAIAEAPWRAPEATEAIVANSKAVIRIGGERAFYSPDTDHIQMPPANSFPSAGAWSSTIIHELAHNAAPWIMPRGRRGRLVGRYPAARRVGIIKALRGRRAACHQVGTGLDSPLVRPCATRLSPSAADQHGCRSASSRRTRAPTKGRSRIDRPRAGAAALPCCVSGHAG